MSNKELINITGGASAINGSILNAMAKVFSIILEIGRAIGSSINRAKNGKVC